MDKIGVSVEVSKSGKNKDMGSPFRETTSEERALLQELTDTIGKRFINLVKQHRKLDDRAIDRVATARVFTAKEALDLGLIDEIGYLTDAIKSTKTLAGLPDEQPHAVPCAQQHTLQGGQVIGRQFHHETAAAAGQQ